MALTALKIIFVILLCVPVAYMMVFFLTRLINQIVKKNKS